MEKKLLKGIVAGMMTLGLSSGLAQAEDSQPIQHAGSGGIECHGGNMCKAKGACGGEGYGCAGNNACLGKGFVMVNTQQECDKLKAKVQAKLKEKNHKDKSAKKKA